MQSLLLGLRMRIRQLVLIAGMLLIASASTAKICKTVGPDGSVVYTDRPTGSCNDDKEQTPPAAVADKSKRAVEPTPKAATSAPDPNVEKALVGVLGLEDKVERTRTFCVRAVPASTLRYDAAAEGWKQRNAAIVGKARRALAQTFAPAQQQLIDNDVERRNLQSMGQVTAAPKASQATWCDQSIAEIESRALDPKENLTAPLAPY